MNPRNLSDSNEVMSVITGVGKLSIAYRFFMRNQMWTYWSILNPKMKEMNINKHIM